MFFTSSLYSTIPIWENSHRLKALAEFRQALTQYGQILQNTAWGYGSIVDNNSALVQHRSWLNQRLHGVYRIIRLSGVHPIIQRFGVTYDLLMNLFTDWTGKDLELAFDLIDQAIGVYQDDKNHALFRTFWPFFWFGVFADWIAEIPFRMLRKLGLGAVDTSGGLARFFRGIVSLFVWFIGIAASVLGILEFFGLRESCLKLIGWK
jgi:hypothetical protein